METGDDNNENTGDPNHENMLESSNNIDQDSIIDTIDSFDFSQCYEQLISKTHKVKQSAVEISRVFNFSLLCILKLKNILLLK